MKNDGDANARAEQRRRLIAEFHCAAVRVAVAWNSRPLSVRWDLRVQYEELSRALDALDDLLLAMEKMD